MPAFEIEDLKSLKQHEGREFPATDWFVMSENRIQKFSEATEDFQWIHTNAERARRESPFGGTIAHGLVTLSLLPHFMHDLYRVDDVAMAINYGWGWIRATMTSPPDRAASSIARLAEVTLSPLFSRQL